MKTFFTVFWNFWSILMEQDFNIKQKLDLSEHTVTNSSIVITIKKEHCRTSKKNLKKFSLSKKKKTTLIV